MLSVQKPFIFLIVMVFSFFIIACTPEKIIEKQYVCIDGSIVNTSSDCTAKNLQVVQDKQVQNKQIETETQKIEEKQAANNSDAQKDVVKQEVKQETVKEYTFSLEQIRNLDKKLIGKRAAFLSDTMATPVWINGSYTFGYAVQSDLVKPNQFKLDIKFLEARTKTNGKIGADELTEKWFIGVEGMEFNLSKGEKKYIPLTFKVWDIVNKDSLPTFEGTYTFDVVVYSKEQEDESKFNDVYTLNRLYILIGKIT